MNIIIHDRIRSREVEFSNNFTVNLRYDSVASSFAFNIRFDPNNPEHASLVEVGHYHIVRVEHNGERLLTGYILSEKLRSSSKTHLVAISGYSLAGVIEDCSVPPETPLQYDNLNLKEIASKITEPFVFNVKVDRSVLKEMEKPYEVTSIKPTQTIKSYLSEMAFQKNIIISHNSYGHLLFTRVRTNLKPILNLDENSKYVEMSLIFDGQKMHSDITVVKQASSGNAGEFTIKNPYVPYVYRPKTIIQNSGDDIDTELVAKMELAKELKGIKLTVTLSSFEINGKIIKPNNTITVINPELSIFKKSTWFIESVKMSDDPKKDSCVFTCVLPEVYNGETPKYIFSLH